MVPRPLSRLSMMGWGRERACQCVGSGRMGERDGWRGGKGKSHQGCAGGGSRRWDVRCTSPCHVLPSILDPTATIPRAVTHRASTLTSDDVVSITASAASMACVAPLDLCSRRAHPDGTSITVFRDFRQFPPREAASTSCIDDDGHAPVIPDTPAGSIPRAGCRPRAG